MNILTRSEVYELIDSERYYQEKKWGPTETKGIHSFTEFIAYIEDYLNEAKHILAREGIATARPKVQSILPKAAAMMISCLEQNGAVGR